MMHTFSPGTQVSCSFSGHDGHRERSGSLVECAILGRPQIYIIDTFLLMLCVNLMVFQYADIKLVQMKMMFIMVRLFNNSRYGNDYATTPLKLLALYMVVQFQR